MTENVAYKSSLANCLCGVISFISVKTRHGMKNIDVHQRGEYLFTLILTNL